TRPGWCRWGRSSRIDGQAVRASDARGIDEHELRILDRGDPDAGHFADRGAITRIERDPVDLDLARGRHQVAVPAGAGEVVLGRLARLEGGAEDAGVGADRQRVVIAFD